MATPAGLAFGEPAVEPGMTAIKWSRVTLVVALLTGVILTFAPLASMSECVASITGIEDCTTTRHSLVENEGIGVVALLFIPALLALGPVVRPASWSRVTLALLLMALAMVGIASVGLLLVPTLVLAWVAMLAGGSRQPESAVTQT